MIMSVSFLAPAFLAGAAAAAIVFAPTAGADAPDLSGTARDVASESSDRGSAAVRQPGPANSPSTRGYSPDLPAGWLNEAQFAKPGKNPFGAGPMPNILALD